MAGEARSRLLQQLLADPGFRAAFRADPERALRAAGLADLAEIAASSPARKAFETLEVRESRSSLAGAMMAVVAEGLALGGPAAASAASHAPAPAAASHAPAPAAEPHVQAAAIGPAAVAPAAGAAAPASPAGSLDPDDVVEVVERRNVAAGPSAPAAGVESDGPDGGGGDQGDGSDDSSGDENEPDENESDSGDSGDDSSDDDQDAPGEGSNGEDANDDASDGDSSDGDDGSDSSDGGDDSAPDLGDPGDYPGDSASPADIAHWMGAEAQKRGIPAELPVMAALTESGLQNLDGGDRDSVGFFQMRVGIWNNGAYAGYPSQPEKQLDWFLDHAEAVKAQRHARGLAVDDPNQYGDWIADIERPAAEYRGRYQLHYDRAHELLQSADKKTDNAAANAIDAAPGGSLHAGRQAAAALAAAKSQLGVPYRWGGSSPGTGFDCSGLVQWAYAKVGIRIPRVTDQQILATNGTAVDRRHLLPGDLVFFRDSSGYVHHVGMSLGGDKFINAPHTGDVVKISSLADPYWKREFAGGRRFDDAVADRPKAHEEAARAAEVDGDAKPVDDRAVRIAQAALERDAAEVNTNGTLLNLALAHQESGKDYVQALPAVRRSQLRG
jgi:cell wall-associated NlpC family hydrolase